jgi:hypothetical protein
MVEAAVVLPFDWVMKWRSQSGKSAAAPRAFIVPRHEQRLPMMRSFERLRDHLLMARLEDVQRQEHAGRAPSSATEKRQQRGNIGGAGLMYGPRFLVR